ncbi:MAG: hypothetical protein H6821_07125 [Planctomycetaceae bacterium]|nr:hypothetical protein [Planctomycetaceae bacterium]MCB9938600.1 hypothetical protein [Planctomycetaceae bacterium]
MPLGIKPTVDLAFKNIFGNTEHVQSLIAVCNFTRWNSNAASPPSDVGSSGHHESSRTDEGVHPSEMFFPLPGILQG